MKEEELQRKRYEERRTFMKKELQRGPVKEENFEGRRTAVKEEELQGKKCEGRTAVKEESLRRKTETIERYWTKTSQFTQKFKTISITSFETLFNY